MKDEEDVRRLLVPPDEEYGEPISARESWVFWLTVVFCGGLMLFATVELVLCVDWTPDRLLGVGLLAALALYRLWRL